LYFASGLDCVGLGAEARMDEKSIPAYTWLPERRGKFSPAWEGRCLSLYRCNLMRKWPAGECETRFRRRTLMRLWDWGFTSLGNWRGDGVCGGDKLPYFSMGPETGSLKVEYIAGDLCDVFDPRFESEARRAARSLSAQKDDPWLVGYFIDNELPWYELVE